MIRTSSPSLKEIRAKVEAGERLSLDEGLLLYQPEVPLGEVGELANLVRERKNGNLLNSSRSSTVSFKTKTGPWPNAVQNRDEREPPP